MAEAVTVKQENTLQASAISDRIDARKAAYGLGAVNTDLWFSHEATRARGDMGIFGQTYYAACAILTASSEEDNRDIPIEDEVKGRLVSTIKKPNIADTPLQRPVRERIGDAFQIAIQLRKADLAWREANAVWKPYSEKAIPERDPDKINSKKIQELVDVFGISVADYGKLVYQRILDQPDRIPNPTPPPAMIDNEFITLAGIEAAVDMEIRGAATPQGAVLQGEFNAAIPGTGTPPLPMGPMSEGDAVVLARRTIAKQLFANLGGASEANNERKRLNKKPLKGIAGEDPWGGVVEPMSYDYNALKKFHDEDGGMFTRFIQNRFNLNLREALGLKLKINKLYEYMRDNYNSDTPWKHLVQGMSSNGGMIPEDDSTLVPGYNIVTATKVCQREQNVVAPVKEILEGGDKLLEVIAGVIGRYRTSGGDRNTEAMKLFNDCLDIMADGKKAPPFKQAQWWGFHDTTLKSYGINFNSSYATVDQKLSHAISRAGGERSFPQDMAVSFINLLQIIGVDKPNLIK